MHSAVGRRAGITKEEYLSLIKLDKKDFVYREWVALTYAREWTFEKGNEFSNEINNEFMNFYSLQEQLLIKKLLRTMLFSNYCGNAYFKRPWKKSEEKIQTCEVNFGMPKPDQGIKR
jgi:hypothetical protein